MGKENCIYVDKKGKWWTAEAEIFGDGEIHLVEEKTAEEIKGSADAEAARIYANAYNKDPEFYNFWKSMESYKKTLKEYDATYSTNMDYFKYLYSAQGN